MTQKNETGVNLNSYLISGGMSLLLLMVGWVANKTSQNNDEIKSLSASLPYMQQSVTRLEGSLSTLVTRAEFSSELNALKTDTTSIRAEVVLQRASLDTIKETVRAKK